jgi:tripartite-type tricarboxylate transporter receptor subunit TctC
MKRPAGFIRNAAVAIACACGPLATATHAQPFPAHAVRMIVPFSAGSGSDAIGRVTAAGMTAALGQQVIVDNRGGAAGNIGAELAARASPDGYTLFLANLGHAANVTLYDNLGYDLVRDFAPVTQVATSPGAVVVHPSLPARTIAELVGLARARPGAINLSSGGTGSAMYVAGEIFRRQANITWLHIPYKSGGEALTAVISGEASVFFSPVATVLPHTRTGRLRALAVTSVKRLPLMPQTPTIAESGYPGYEAGNWYGLLVPAKTPRDRIVVLRSAAIAGLTSPAVSKQLVDLGFLFIGDEPEAFLAHIRSQIEKLRILKGAS